MSGSRGDARTLTATLHIPAAQLDAAMSTLKSIGRVVDEAQSGEDVTEQVVDVTARLANARNTEKRLTDLLQKRTGDLADVLAAEREIARVREEIERFDAQRQALGRRVTYATLNLEIVEEPRATLNLGPRPLPGRFREALVTGVTDCHRHRPRTDAPRDPDPSQPAALGRRTLLARSRRPTLGPPPRLNREP